MINREDNINFAVEVYKKIVTGKSLNKNEQDFVDFFVGKEKETQQKALDLLEVIKQNTLVKINQGNLNVIFDFENEMNIYFENINLHNEIIYNVLSKLKDIHTIETELNNYSKTAIKKHFKFAPVQDSVLLSSNDFLEIEKEIGRLNKSLLMKQKHIENNIIRYINNDRESLDKQILKNFDGVNELVENVRDSNQKYFCEIGHEADTEIQNLRLLDCFILKDNVQIRNNLPESNKLVEVEFDGVKFEGRQYGNLKAMFSVRRRAGHERDYIDYISESNNIIAKPKEQRVKRARTVEDKTTPLINFNDISKKAKETFGFFKTKAKEAFENVKELLDTDITEISSKIKEIKMKDKYKLYK